MAYETMESGGHVELTTAIFSKVKEQTDGINDRIDNVAAAGIVPAFLTDAPKYTAGWLSLSESRVESQTTTDPGTGEETTTNVTVYGEPLTPTEGTVYVVLSDGAFLRQLFTWNGTVYRHVGKMNVREDADIIVYDDRTFNVTPQDAGSNYNTERTSWQGDVVAGEIVDISVVVDNGEGGSTKLYWGEEIVWIAGISTSGTQTYHRVANADINVKLCARSNTSTGAKGGAIRSGTVRIHKEYADHETLEYVPSTADKDGQSGLVPPSPTGTDSSTVLTSQGWDEHRFDLTDEEITELFARSTENSAGPMYVATQEFQRYSTDEIVVGEWTDGKPLYRKTIDFGALPNATIKGVPHNIENLGNIWRVYGCAVSPGKYVYPIPFVDNSEPISQIMCNCTDSKVVITTTSDLSFVGMCYITLEYTKTTDVASSPKVPYEPLVEYGTEEKMIGFWIDGKPLYRKTVDIGSLPNNADKDVQIGADSIDMIVKAQGFAARTDNGNMISLPYAHKTTSLCVAIAYIKASNALRIGTGSDMRNYYGYVTIEYTKTTA